MAGMIVAVADSMGTVGVTAEAVGLARLCVLVGFKIAVGTLPTGLSTFLAYVFATSYRQPTRLLIAGIRKMSIASSKRPAAANKMFLFDMQKSVPEEYESKLI